MFQNGLRFFIKNRIIVVSKEKERKVTPMAKSILLVDDRIKTGSTIKLARELLKEARSIKTFAVNGTADYALFDEACFKFPWIL